MSLYPYFAFPYYNPFYNPYYPYYGLLDDYKINGLLNEYDELNQLALENQDIYLQNMLDDYKGCKGCTRDNSGHFIPCVLPPPDLSRNNTFPIPPHLYPYNGQLPFHHPPNHHPPFHYPPYHPYPPYGYPPYFPPRPPYFPPRPPPYPYPYPYTYTTTPVPSYNENNQEPFISQE